MGIKTHTLIFSALLWSHALFASYVTVNDEDDPTVRAGKASATDVVVVEAPSSGDGSDESDPYVVYVPVKDAGGNEAFSIWSNDLPEFTAGYISFVLDVNNDSAQDLYLYAAVEDDDDKYRIVKKTALQIYFDTRPAASGIVEVTVSVSIVDLCSSAGGCSISSNNSTTVLEKNLHFFLSSDDSIADATEITPSSEGIYYALGFSNQHNTTDPVITNTIPGDQQILLEFDGPNISYGYRTYVFSYGAGGQAAQDIATADRSNILFYEEDYIYEGTLKVNQLTNYTTYHLGIALCNKFLFCTNVSASASETPQEIDSFLEKTACYMVSAGFQREHYILNYFREFRDQILLKTSIGKELVGFYYRTASRYARYVYSSNLLRGTVILSCYLIYFCLKYYIGIVLVILAAFFLYRRRRRLFNSSH